MPRATHHAGSGETDPDGGRDAAPYPNTRWIRRLFGYCWRYRRALLLAVGASLAISGLAALTPLIVRQVVDESILNDREPLAPWLLLLIGAGLARGLCAFVRRYCSGRVGFGVDYSLRTELFTSLQHLDGRQQDRLQTGQVVSRVTSDVTAVERLVSIAPMMLAGVLQFLLSLVVMAVLSPVLTIVALVIAPTLFVVTRRGAKAFFPAKIGRAHV